MTLGEDQWEGDSLLSHSFCELSFSDCDYLRDSLIPRSSDRNIPYSSVVRCSLSLLGFELYWLDSYSAWWWFVFFRESAAVCPHRLHLALGQRSRSRQQQRGSLDRQRLSSYEDSS